MHHNPVGYFEIPVIDLERAIALYAGVFACSFERVVIDDNEMALFPLYDEAPGITGALTKGESYRPSTEGSRLYFSVATIDETLQRVQESGGKTLYPKTAIGELGFVAEFEDSEGNRVALHSP